MSVIQFHECLGRGGYGEVYRATWIRPDDEDRVVAVKVLNTNLSTGSEASQRLRDEARMLGALHHPSVLRVWDLCEVKGQTAMIAEYVPGEDLDRCMLEGLPKRALLDVLTQVADALDAAWTTPHAITEKPLRLVHRDVKPENIRITPNGEVKLLDFGVARTAELRREAETSTNTIMGSVRYLAPERFDADLEPAPAIDMFALGCILYEGLSYRRLFEQLSIREMMVLSLPDTERYTDHIAEKLEDLPDDTEARLVNLIHRLVDKQPDRRPTPRQLVELCNAAKKRVDGASLREWCDARDWSLSEPKDGEWSGREFELPLQSTFLGEDDTPHKRTPGPDPDTETSPAVRLAPDEHTGLGPMGLGFADLDDLTPSKTALPVPDPVTSTDAVNSLSAATSTPTGSNPRIPVVVPPSATEDGAATASDTGDATEDTTDHDLEDELDLDALRAGIGMVAQAPSPRQRPKPKGQGAVYANLAVLAGLAVVALIALVVIVVILVTG